MTEIFDELGRLNEVQTIHLFRRLGQIIFAGLKNRALDEMVPESIQRLGPFSRLQNENQARRSDELGPAHAAAVARLFLMEICEDPSLERVIRSLLGQSPSDLMIAQATVPRGLPQGFVKLLAAEHVETAIHGEALPILPRRAASIERLATATLDEQEAQYALIALESRLPSESRRFSNAPDPAPLPNKEDGDEVELKAYHPKELEPDRKYKLLAYAHTPEETGEVDADARRRLSGARGDYRRVRKKDTVWLQRGTNVDVTVELPGCRVTPRKAGFQWVDDVHRVEFSVKASRSMEGFVTDSSVQGRVIVWVGPVIIGEIPISVFIADQAADTGTTEWGGRTYRQIFCSYSRKDDVIVRWLEVAYKAMGDNVLRDTRDFRSGENWIERMENLVYSSDVFQLYWSTTSSTSKSVNLEWSYALGLERKHFIRPLTWENPEPELPPEMARLSLHYERIEPPV